LVLPVLARKRRNSLEIKFDVLKVISLGVEASEEDFVRPPREGSCKGCRRQAEEVRVN